MLYSLGMIELDSPDFRISRKLRLDTLIRLRWLAIGGQSVAILVVGYFLGFPLAVAECAALIACSVALNIYLTLAFPATHRLDLGPALAMLLYDGMQLAGLLYLTGGITNPFVVLMLVPVVISATALPARHTILLAAFSVFAVTFMMFQHRPLPWMPEASFTIPPVYKAGVWVAVVLTTLFTCVYAWRVADEARKLAGALAATELVLQREQHLTALDGLAAAAAHELGTPLATIALVAKEMEKSAGPDSEFAEDIRLLRSQSERCRDILRQLTSLSSETGSPLSRLPLTSLVEEVAAPHREFGIEVALVAGTLKGREPVTVRNPGLIYGMGNLVENAVDFARKHVEILWRYDDETVAIEIVDDGPGFRAEMLDRIGEPYLTYRPERDRPAGGGGLGLGLFIAKSLLERTGATVRFSNSERRDRGATVTVSWNRRSFEYPDPHQFAIREPNA